MSKITKGVWVANCVGTGGTYDNPVDIYEIVTTDGYARICEYAAEGDARLIAAAPEMLGAMKAAYTILADIRHEWAGRSTAEGQGTLVALRDAIAKATGRDGQEVQDEFTNAKLRA